MPHKTVLLVDDSRVARMMTRAVIERGLPGWTILEAATGEEALEIAEVSPLDFILMDVNMPGMGGMESARQFRARHPAIPLSLLTANIQDSIHEEAARLGVGYISKPLKEELLIRFLSGGDAVP